MKIPEVNISSAAYGQSRRIPVKVYLLDGDVHVGLIYPWYYDNVHEYYLETSDGESIDLGTGEGIRDIEKIGQ